MMGSLIWNFRINKILSSDNLKYRQALITDRFE